ncbi:MAG: hypothetical protein ACFFDN_00925 [Candidatus Hodarchaeota archaeon]
MTIPKKTNFVSVNDLIKQYPSFTEPMMRWYLYNRKENGLYKAVRKIGKRIFINTVEFEKWVEKHREHQK